MSGCELKIDKDGKFFSFNQLAKENPVRERSNSSPKIERLQIKSEVRTLEQSTNLSIFSNNVSKKGARSRSRAERREIKSAAPKESLFEKTQRELDELGALNGAIDVPAVTLHPERNTNINKFSGIITKTAKKPVINQTPVKPGFYTRYKHFQQMPQLPIDVVSLLPFTQSYSLALYPNIVQV